MSESPPGEAATNARDQLEELRAAGALAFDPPAYAFVESLLVRAEALGGTAGKRLAGRAAARADALLGELEGAKRRARHGVAFLGREADALVRRIEAGDVGDALRLARSRAIAPRLRTADDAPRLERLLAEARSRGLSPRAHTRARTTADLSGALYDSARREVRAVLSAIQAEAMIPATTGPYNPLAIAARTLAELSTRAPAYLAALVAQLDELSPLLALPAPPPERSAPSPRRGRRAGLR